MKSLPGRIFGKFTATDKDIFSTFPVYGSIPEFPFTFGYLSLSSIDSN